MSDNLSPSGPGNGGGNAGSQVCLPKGKPGIKTSNKAADLERIRQSLAKRALNVKFDLDGSNYKPIENIGIGAYGVVCSAVHLNSGDRVAIKKIPSIFDALIVAKRTYREIKILKHFKHDNIICIREILMPKENLKDFKDIYVVFDLMESDLHRIIYSNQELSEEHIRYFLYQILRGLKYIHSANVVHRDLKPSNLLVNEDCHLRIGDFGMARGLSYTPDEPSYYMTQYVATRWYRAPEILLSMLEYGTSVDMWSVGCIFAEMMGRKHLFPGKDYISQVKLILGVLGTPSDDLLHSCRNDILKRIIRSFGKKEPVTLSKLFPKASKKSIDLLSKMLVLNPKNRIPVEKALSHRLLNNYHDPDDEPICVPPFNFDFEKQEMTKPQLREVIMEAIRDFHEPKQPSFSFSAFLRPAPKPGDTADKAGVDTSDLISKAQTSDLQARSSRDGVQSTTQAQNQNEASKTPPRPDSGKSGNKKSPVSVDLSKLQLAPSVDIEMLSAQSADGRAMDTTAAVESVEKKAEGKPEEKEKGLEEKDGLKVVASTEKKATNTISEDTKALVKQALMNATQRRQRAESQSEETEKHKPVTAAQRQKEREEKRRKKKERTLEKLKKAKEKKGATEPSFTLSNQDVELLRRWTVMQNPAQKNMQSTSTSPPHPDTANSPPNNTQNASSVPTTIGNVPQTVGSFPSGAAKSSQNQSTNPAQIKPRQILAKASTSAITINNSVNFTSSGMTSGGTVLIPTSQINLSETVIPVIAIPSTTNPGKLEIKRIFPQSATAATQTSSNRNSLASESTKTMLQNAILMRNQSDPALKAKADQESRNNNDNRVSDSAALSSTTSPNFLPQVQNQAQQFSQDSSLAGNAHNFAVSAVNNKEALSLHGDEDQSHSTEKLQLSSDGSDLIAFLDQQIKEDSTSQNLGALASNFTSHTMFQNTAHLPNTQNDSASNLNQGASFSNYVSSHQQPHRQGSNPDIGQVCNSSMPVQHSQMMPEHPNPSHLPFSTYSDQLLSRSYPTQNTFPTANYQSGTSTTAYSQQHGGQEDFQHFNSPDVSPNIGFDRPHELFQNAGGQTNLVPTHQQQHHHQQQQHHHHHQQQQQHGYQHPHSQPMFGSNSNVSFNQTQPNFAMGMNDPFTASSQSSSSSTPPAQHFNSQNFNNFQQQSQSFMPQAQQNFVGAAADFGSGTSQSSQQQQHQQGHEPIAGGCAMFMSSQASTSGSDKKPQGLTVDCHRPLASENDLISMLSKQLSKSQVVDIFPPALALTPRGTGAGYGVGMDLDTLLTDAQDAQQTSGRVEQSPLSSSLLADWLDISGNISQADLEALERELNLQSPMNISYSDVNL